MKCEKCGRREATVRYVEVIDGTTTTWHLCEECAEERGVGGSLTSLAGPLVNILMGLLEGSAAGGASSGGPACPVCGLSYEEFRRGGRLGCAGCYEAFASELKPLLRRIHGSTEHTGRVPGDAEGDYLRRREIRKLKAELATAVAEEDYERAADLRDSIRHAESGLEGALGRGEETPGTQRAERRHVDL
jgi:protein arginine kinase activator